MQLQRAQTSRAVARLGARSRNGAVRVVAWKDNTRGEKLTSIATDYVHAWMKGARRGAPAVKQDLLHVAAPYVTVTSSHSPYARQETQGLEGLLEKVNQDHRRGMYPHRIIQIAANDTTDTVFCLVENMPRRVGNCPGEQDMAETSGIPDWTSGLNDEWAATGPSCPTVSNSILKINIKLPSSGAPGSLPGQVVSVLECAQPAYDTGAAFPESRVVATGEVFRADRNRQLAERWCRALSARGSLDDLDTLTLPSTFRFFDAYGHVDKYARKTATDEGHTLEWLKERNRKVSQEYSIRAHVVNTAASRDHTMGFTHWAADFVPHPEVARRDDSKKPFTVNCVQAETYDTAPTGELRLTSVWAFRDLMRPERT